MGSLVLVIDRDDVERRYISALLAADGFDVRQVARAVEGLVAATAAAPALIILAAGRSQAGDAKRVSLPDLVRVFRRITSAPLAIVGDPESSDEARALESGADLLLPSGFGASELISRTRMLTRREGSAFPSGDSPRTNASASGDAPSLSHVARAFVNVLTDAKTANGSQAA